MISAEDLAVCGHRIKLEERVSVMLRRIATLATRQADVIADRSDTHASDQEIEVTLRYKDRAMGALEQHRLEHGC
jgi:hypothetical protein